ncbi:MAG: sigma 54-interacting transcriptional regulator [Myxococcaceae bacterium]|nr:sigma 54-interacting transcriptional regulator [Myxococcaceae bacterium]
MTSSSTRPVSAEYPKLPARLRLVARADGVLLARHEFTRGRVTVGSAPGNDLVLEHPTVSRKHLELSAEGDALHVKDLQSKNGTRLFGLKLTEGFVSVGHVLVVGVVELRVEDGTKADAATFGGLVAVSDVMRDVLERLRALAASTKPVLLTGEPGVGHDAAARALHLGGPRATKPLELVSGRAFSTATGEAALFGHAKGVVPGAGERPGALSKASGGTLVLDGPEALPLPLQAKLLSALQARTVERLGDGARAPLDVRLVTTSDKDLAAEVKAGRLSGELVTFLSAETVALPPLRERLDDLPVLVRQMLEALGPRARGFSVSAETLARLEEHPWRGNVAELRDWVEQALAVGGVTANPGATLDDEEPDAAPATPQTLDYKRARDEVLTSFEKEFVTHLLRTFDGNISKAAREAGVDRAYLHRLIKRHGLDAS